MLMSLSFAPGFGFKVSGVRVLGFRVVATYAAVVGIVVAAAICTILTLGEAHDPKPYTP